MLQNKKVHRYHQWTVKGFCYNAIYWSSSALLPTQTFLSRVIIRDVYPFPLLISTEISDSLTHALSSSPDFTRKQCRVSALVCTVTYSNITLLCYLRWYVYFDVTQYQSRLLIVLCTTAPENSYVICYRVWCVSSPSFSYLSWKVAAPYPSSTIHFLCPVLPHVRPYW